MEVGQRQVLFKSAVLKELIREPLEDFHMMPRAFKFEPVMLSANNTLLLQIGESVMMAEDREGGVRIMLARTAESRMESISS